MPICRHPSSLLAGRLEQEPRSGREGRCCISSIPPPTLSSGQRINASGLFSRRPHRDSEISATFPRCAPPLRRDTRGGIYLRGLLLGADSRGFAGIRESLKQLYYTMHSAVEEQSVERDSPLASKDLSPICYRRSETKIRISVDHSLNARREDVREGTTYRTYGTVPQYQQEAFNVRKSRPVQRLPLVGDRPSSRRFPLRIGRPDTLVPFGISGEGKPRNAERSRIEGQSME